ncbi:helix-hairpin-helix domain-containing protein [Bacillus piscicola]|uniref:helix-hairpin-helix domain-containing protein n=1 Tax=Bacillus piscicola TaxID=1632684 RepID=UPI001F08B63B|nr:helix-hairpin-helix domain-containing protein [Bacillus piscicola]
MEWNKKIYLYAGAGILVLVVLVLIVLPNKEEENIQSFLTEEEWPLGITVDGEKASGSGKEESENGLIAVDVKGEVNKPGVYELSNEKRVIDAIDLAGGVTENGNPNSVNFAERLRDEMVVYVAIKGDEETGESTGKEITGSSGQNDKVRINYADETELQTLPNIGPAKSAAIITFREENGQFQNNEDLLHVPGIGEKSLEQLTELITVN